MFALIHNDQIEVGPRDWNFAIFREYLVDNDLATEADALLSRTAPTDVVQGSTWKVVKAQITASVAADSTYEQLVGPSWTIVGNTVNGGYTKQDAPIAMVKGHLLDTVTKTRYIAENSYVSIVINDVMVQVPTDRETRSVFLTGMPGKWKFKKLDETELPGAEVSTYVSGDVWLTVTAETLYTIQTLIQTYVQECFDWEARVTAEIEAATTLAQLKLIDLTFTSVISVNG